MVSRTGYPEAAYTHQGSLTLDKRWFLFGHELDEQGGSVPSTTTYVADVRNLGAVPQPVPVHRGTSAIDHNLYTHGRHVYESNYTAGLRIFEQDTKSLRAGRMDEVAYFDVFPAGDPTEFAGTWSNHRFGSGTTVVSTIDSGLFVLKPTVSPTRR